MTNQEAAQILLDMSEDLARYGESEMEMAHAASRGARALLALGDMEPTEWQRELERLRNIDAAFKTYFPANYELAEEWAAVEEEKA